MITTRAPDGAKKGQLSKNKNKNNLFGIQDYSIFLDSLRKDIGCQDGQDVEEAA